MTKIWTGVAESGLIYRLRECGGAFTFSLMLCKRPSNTPVGGIVFVMNSGYECGCWSVGWSS
jgi:hypothetical protein